MKRKQAAWYLVMLLCITFALSVSQPSVPTAITIPSDNYVSNTTTVTASGSVDPDGDSFAYYYLFYNVNDSKTLQNWSTSGSYTIAQSDAHDTIIASAKASDGYDNVSLHLNFSYLSFDSQQSTAYDISDNGNNATLSGFSFNHGTASGFSVNDGTITGAVHTTGYHGTGMYCDGVNDKVEVASGYSPLENATAATICFWMNYPYDQYKTIIEQRDVFSIMGNTASRFYVTFAKTSAFTGAVSQTGEHHYCFMWESATGRVNVTRDGAYVGAATTGSHPLNASLDNIHICERYNGDYDANLIYIDDIRVWNRYLSVSEAQAEMSSDHPVKGDGLVLSYEFDSSRDTTTIARDTNYLVAGPNGEGVAYNLNGVDKRINLTEFQVDMENGGSFTFWGKSNADVNAAITGNSSTNAYMYTAILSGTGRLQGETDTNTDLFNSQDVGFDADWHHWAVACDDFQCDIFRDGINVTNDGTVTDNLSIAHIGSRSSDLFWNGSIAMFSYYPQKINPEQINQSMYNTSPIHQPIGAWIFSDSHLQNDTHVPDVKHLTASTVTDAGIDLGEAISFDGVDDYLDLGNDLFLDNYDGNFTISAVYNQFGPDSTGNDGAIFTAGNDMIFKFYSSGDGFRFRVKNDTLYSELRCEDTAFISQNTAHHFAGVRFNNGTMRLYVDGTDRTSDCTVISEATGALSDMSNYAIGGYSAGGPFYLTNGTIDEVKIHPKALTASEALDLYRLAIADFSDEFNQSFTVNNSLPLSLSSISPATAYTNDSLFLSCNSSDAEMDGLNLHYRVFKNETELQSGIHYQTIETNTDDFAIVTVESFGADVNFTQTGTGAWDNDYSTAGSVGTSWSYSSGTTYAFGHFFTNFTVNGSFSDLMLEYKVGAYDSALMDVWGQESDYIRVYCYNETGWEQLHYVNGTESAGTGVDIFWGNLTIPARCIHADRQVKIYYKAYAYKQASGSAAFSFYLYEDSIHPTYSTAYNVNIDNLTSSDYVKGDNITLSCLAYDGYDNSTWENATITISNRPPDISGVNLTNQTVYIGQTLTGNWSFSDIDSDSDTSYYRWWVNGTVILEGQYNGSWPQFSDFSNVNDNITFGVLGNDGTGNSTEWVNSSIFTVQDFNVSVTVNSLTYFNYSVLPNSSVNFSIEIEQPYDATLEYNISDGHNATLIRSLAYNVTELNVSGTSKTEISVDLLANDTAGTDIFNITVTRTGDGHAVTLTATIHISNNATVITITPFDTWSASVYTDQVISRSVTVRNTGYAATGCQFQAQAPLSTYFTAETFNIATNEEKSIQLYVSYPDANIYTGTITLYCQNSSVEGVPLVHPDGIDYIILATVKPNNPGGGGGAGSTEEEEGKPVCSLVIEPISITLKEGRNSREVSITNNDEVSYTPDFGFKSLQGDIAPDLEITNTIGTVLPGRSASFGVKYDPGAYMSGKAILTLSSQNCADVNITITTLGSAQSDSFLELIFGSDNRFIDILKEPIFPESSSLRAKTPLFNFTAALLFFSLVWFGILFEILSKSIEKAEYFKLFLTLLFMLFAVIVTTVLFVAFIRIIA